MRQSLVRLSRSLIAIDVDGTLIGSSRHISRRVRDAVLRVQEYGATVVLATGRQPFSASPVAEELGASGAHIVADGSMIWHANTNHIDMQVLIPNSALRKAIGLAKLLHVSIVVYRASSSEGVINDRDLDYMLSYGDPHRGASTDTAK